MKKVSRYTLAVSTALLVIDVIYIIKHLQMMNILHFLGMVILCPCVLVSLIIASLIAETCFQEVKQQGIITGIAGALLAIMAYIVAGKNQDYIETIIKNSKQMAESSSLLISDIGINNGISSYIFIFLMIFILSMEFNILFNILRERRRK